jgi:prepilin-type N-terminal cleavage/methylation domain-containing protein
MSTAESAKQMGFTVVELMMVVVVMGVLASIAFAEYANYRKQSFRAAVRTDLRNAAVAQEAYFAAHARYQDVIHATAVNLPGFAPSHRVRVSAAAIGLNRFTLSGTHTNCGAAIWSYDSASGIASDPICP